MTALRSGGVIKIRTATTSSSPMLYEDIYERFGTWESASGYTINVVPMLNFTDANDANFHKGTREFISLLPDQIKADLSPPNDTVLKVNALETIGKRIQMVKIIATPYEKNDPIFSTGSTVFVPVSRPSTKPPSKNTVTGQIGNPPPQPQAPTRTTTNQTDK
jgi:hypothetical protein